MTILEEDGRLLGYRHKVNNVTTDFPVDPITGQSDILHIKNFHPTDDWWGAAATESSSREIDTSNDATAWNKTLLQNQGRPGMLYIFKESMNEEEYARFEESINEKYSGAANAGKNMIVEGDADVKPYGFSMNELDFNEGQIKLARRICMGYRVPPELIGIQDATFTNRPEARLQFWEDTVSYYHKLYANELNNWLLPQEENTFLKFILDTIAALEPKRDKLWERAEKSSFLTINEKRKMTGHDPHPDGDVILVSANMLPLGMEIPEDTESDNPKDEPENEDDDDGDEKAITLTKAELKLIDSEYND
jgi:HK97 family phage portal protein